MPIAHVDDHNEQEAFGHQIYMRQSNLLPEDGEAYLLTDAFHANHFGALKNSIAWEEETIVIFGEKKRVPRLTAYYGKYNYRYSGVDHPARPLTKDLLAIQEVCEQEASFQFNSVLCNYYRGGEDSMGYHRDNEPVMDRQCIASVSFGATRRMNFRHRTSKKRVGIDLPSGSLLLMINCQDHWEHGVPKTKKLVDGRINLTYRLIRASAT